ncbi:tRNA (guanosine(46)-N7)-methyltransferase TrmB [Alkaliflexus imshenetskii]|uniref:tRNA (guanosine(46)-N7)-methyltransferase TrmB n=1 Tax=Alkaliflexus imshenetskii TaxID=286730 RepID=UPI00047D9216|nr:tRNA (guanosine(46)-N7)-methyltransferase TrmB [Alkaliflexus imshenetskii]
MAKNKLQKFSEMEAFPHVVQAEFDEVFRKDYKLKGGWGELFFKNNNPIVIELGCGKGEYSVGLARHYPDKNFIGVDIKGSRMHTGAAQAFNEGLTNVAFLRTRIELITSFFAQAEIDEIWLTFPDPQLNKTRKRLTSCRFLNLYAGFLKPGGLIHLKTDSRFLYTYTKELTSVNKLNVIRDFDDLYNSGFEDDILGIKTYYEERFLSHNISIKYINFQLNNQIPLVEPEVEIPKDIYHNAGRSVKLYANEQEAPRNLNL